MCQTDNDVVVVDVAESGVVPALPSGLFQDQIPAVHSRKKILVFSETAKETLQRLKHAFLDLRILASSSGLMHVDYNTTQCNVLKKTH